MQTPIWTSVQASKWLVVQNDFIFTGFVLSDVRFVGMLLIGLMISDSYARDLRIGLVDNEPNIYVCTWSVSIRGGGGVGGEQTQTKPMHTQRFMQTPICSNIRASKWLVVKNGFTFTGFVLIGSASACFSQKQYINFSHHLRWQVPISLSGSLYLPLNVSKCL